MGEDGGLYEELGVPPSATPEEILAAYRALARAYHPDRNPAPAAAERMKRINAAYAVLRSPERRADYDVGLRREGGAPAPAGAPAVRCERCGRLDASLRVSVFTTVAGVPLFARRRAEGACLCSDCRRSAALAANLRTAALGLWALPLGSWWALRALWRNGLGGEQPRAANAGLLRAAAAALASRGSAVEALAAEGLALAFSDDPAAAARLESRLATQPALRPAVQGATRRASRGVGLQWMAPAAAVLGALVLSGVVTGAVRAFPAPPRIPTAAPAGLTVAPARGTASAWWNAAAPAWNRAAQAEAAFNGILRQANAGTAGWRQLSAAGLALQSSAAALQGTLAGLPPAGDPGQALFVRDFAGGVAEWAVGAGDLVAAAAAQDAIRTQTAIATIQAGDGTLLQAERLMPAAMLPGGGGPAPA